MNGRRVTNYVFNQKYMKNIFSLIIRINGKMPCQKFGYTVIQSFF